PGARLGQGRGHGCPALDREHEDRAEDRLLPAEGGDPVMKYVVVILAFLLALAGCGGDGGDGDAAEILDANGIPTGPSCRGGDAVAVNGSVARGGDACVTRGEEGDDDDDFPGEEFPPGA